jgi:hypothetical protein
MALEELKLYTVRVNNGSGNLFQPILNGDEFTYILTAKHLFENGMRDENDEIIHPISDGTEISIFRQVNGDGQWQKIPIPFTLTRGVTYFPHLVADAAILKIDFLPGFDQIVSIDIPRINALFYLNGFPNQFEGQPGEEYTTYSIKELEASGDYSQNAQLTNNVLNKLQVEGMSGGGILELKDGQISILGIQSRIKHPQFANGKICFVPMKYFSEIINYEEYTTFLTRLHPPFVGKFDFLKDEAFALKVDAWDENAMLSLRIHLRNKALSVIESDVTPIGIKELFKNRLLIDENEAYCLDTKNIWIAWLEFLTIMNIVKENSLTIQQLNETFDSIRLKYLDTNDWTDFVPNKLSKSDYLGLQPDSTVIVSTRTAPERPFIIPKGKIVDIARTYDKSGFRTDKGIDPFTSFNFVHLDYFKKKCIIDKMAAYQNLSEQEFLALLKNEYNELFN